MRIAIATPEQAGDRWTPFLCEFVHPLEIRRRILVLLEAEESGQPENLIITLNRTVLDMVTHPNSKSVVPLGYDDIEVWDGEKLVPLLTLHSWEWMSHFSLGDLFDRGELDSGRTS